MLYSIKHAREALSNLPRKWKKIHTILNNIDWNLLDQMVEFFRFFLDQRTNLSKEGEITLHKVIPVKHALKRHIENSLLEPVIKTNFLNALEDKFILSDYHLSASFLFPYYYFQSKPGTFSANDESKIDKNLLSVCGKFKLDSGDSKNFQEPFEIQKDVYEDFIIDQVDIIVSIVWILILEKYLMSKQISI